MCVIVYLYIYILIHLYLYLYIHIIIITILILYVHLIDMCIYTFMYYTKVYIYILHAIKLTYEYGQ